MPQQRKGGIAYLPTTDDLSPLGERLISEETVQP